VKANVLFFDKKRVSAQPNTKELWIYDLRTNQRFTLKERPMMRADLDDLVACYKSGQRHERAQTDRFQHFVALFLGAKLNVAALTDFAKSDRRKLDAPRQSRILESDRLLTFARILNLEEADAEDVFDPNLYAFIGSEAFHLKRRTTLLSNLSQRLKLVLGGFLREWKLVST
jgi:hypothetical protein